MYQKIQTELQIYLNLLKTEPLEPPFKLPPPEPDSIDVSIASKEEIFEPSCSNNPNCHSNLECKVEASAIKDFDSNSSDHSDPSGYEYK